MSHIKFSIHNCTFLYRFKNENKNVHQLSFLSQVLAAEAAASVHFSIFQKIFFHQFSFTFLLLAKWETFQVFGRRRKNISPKLSPQQNCLKRKQQKQKLKFSSPKITQLFLKLHFTFIGWKLSGHLIPLGRLNDRLC